MIDIRWNWLLSWRSQSTWLPIQEHGKGEPFWRAMQLYVVGVDERHFKAVPVLLVLRDVLTYYQNNDGVETSYQTIRQGVVFPSCKWYNSLLDANCLQYFRSKFQAIFDQQPGWFSTKSNAVLKKFGGNCSFCRLCIQC